MSLDAAREAYDEALGAHDAGQCDPLCCPWCNGYDPDPEDFESEDDHD